MKSKILVAGVALAVLAAGAAYAGPQKGAKASSRAAVASPSQPVPYPMLDAYLKASPKARAAMLANASSSTMQSDAAATAPASTGVDAGAASSTSTSSSASSTSNGSMGSGATGAGSMDSGSTSSGAMNSGSISSGAAGTTDAGAGVQSGAVNPAPATPPATDSAAPASGGSSTGKQ